MLTFIVVFQSIKVRSDKRAEVVSAKNFDEAYKKACVIQKDSFSNYNIKSISQS
jgi:hypothetical protein